MHTNGSPNILFITQDDPFYIKVFFEEFLKKHPQPDSIKGVVICSAMRKKSRWQLARQMYEFYGPADFVRMALRFARTRLLGSIPRFISGENFYTLAQLFSHYKIPTQRTNAVNSPRFLRQWRNKGIDVLVSVAAPVIFKNALLEFPKWGCINIHHAKLPHYRGMMPNFWQMYHGEKTAGITVHKMNPKIDQGEIILQRQVDIRNGESLDSLITRTKRIGAHCVIEVLRQIADGRVVCRANPVEKGEYFSFPTRKHVREFRRRGKRLL